MTFSKFDFDVITDPGAERERIPWIPLHRPQPSDDMPERQAPGPGAGKEQPVSG
jgi:hypothetical protein